MTHLLLVDNGTELTLSQSDLVKVGELIYYCDECSTDSQDVFHLKSDECWADIDDALGS